MTALPDYAQKWAVVWVHRYEAVGSFDVNLGEQGLRAKLVGNFGYFFSTEVYCKEHGSLSMPSFTLAPSGNERSVISLHFPGTRPLGMTPILLVCKFGTLAGTRGPRNRPSARSDCI